MTATGAAPAAMADPQTDCVEVGGPAADGAVCGNAEVTAPDPDDGTAGNGGFGNGSYGPSGNTPPVGNDG